MNLYKRSLFTDNPNTSRMKPFYPSTIGWLLAIILSLSSLQTFATHAQSADISYTCLGGNSYEITVSFYRDCAGVSAPGSVTVNSSSISCGQIFNTTLYPDPGTGQDVTPICSTMNTECSGGSYPGVQEWVYRGTINLPAACTDWVFSFTLCCRNNAITTINTPGAESIYVEANLDNFNFPCNNSPQFSNPPIPFVCVGQLYCFNHGASDPDGDSLVYTLVPPATGPATFVTYVPGYSATNPVNSATGVTMDPITGDICMTPNLLEVTVMAVLVEEYRAGVLVGSVVRDIQLRTVTCTNNIPYLNGIDNTGNYTMTICAGTQTTFTIPSFDSDAGQNISLSWNNGIPGATFSVNAANPPTATFSWLPTTADISSVPHCFTVTVTDDNCPFNGTQTYAFCITVEGSVSGNIVTNLMPSCYGYANGMAEVTATSGTSPFSYTWNTVPPQIGPSATGLSAGTYMVAITDADNCTDSVMVVITQPDSITPAVVAQSDVTCNGSNDGVATVTANGGSSPYDVSWNTSPPQTGTSVTGIGAGTFVATITDMNGCTASISVSVTEPSPLLVNAFGSDTICSGVPTLVYGTATGGTGAYTYYWNGVPASDSLTVSPPTNTWYTFSATDSMGCVSNLDSVLLVVNNINNVALNIDGGAPICFGDNTTVWASMSGGMGTYSVNWNCGCVGFGPHSVSPPSTTYLVVTITDECANTLSDSVLVEVHELPEITLDPIAATDCGSVDVTISNSVTNPAGSSYYWDFGNGEYSTDEVGSVNYSASGNYPISFTVVSAFGCVNTGYSFAMITVQPKANANFTGQLKVSIFNPTVHFNNTSTDATIYHWNFGDGATSSLENPSHTFEFTGQYPVQLIANNVYGCVDTIVKMLEVMPEFTLYIPNAFTPNGDGYNEIFYAVGEEIAEFEMLIFDRWGEAIFESSSIDSGWDGNYRGVPVESEVYVYKVKVKDSLGEWHDIAGHITLVR